MRANVEELVSHYSEVLVKTIDTFDVPTIVSITPFDKKADKGLASIKMEISLQPEGKKSMTVRGVMYIVEKEKADTVLFVNDNTKDIVFNNFSPNAIEKSEKFIVRYFENSVKRMLGMFDDQKSDKKSN